MTETVIGIDLGTTRSVMASLDSTGEAKILTNSEGELVTPSVVCFDDETILVGRDALRMVPHAPDRVVQFAKREMGNPDFSVEYRGTSYPAAMVQSFVLAKMQRDASTALGQSVDAAVVTVPAFFDEAKRRDTMDAGFLASLDIKAIVNEPTAAAIAYGARHGWLDQSGQFSTSRSVLVYDLGGGTFDVSLVDIKPGQIKVIAVDGNSRLGGIDWDQCLVDWLVGKFSESGAIAEDEIEANLSRLLYEAEQIKQSLTTRNEAPILLSFFGRSLKTSITRTQFDDLTAHLLDRTRFTIKNLLDGCGRTTGNVDAILLVGGSTRMPQVSEMLRDRFRIPVDQSISPDHAVAAGAAIFAGHRLYEKNETLESPTARQSAADTSQAAVGTNQAAADTSQAGPVGSLDVVDVNAHDLGVLGIEIETKRPKRQIIIPKNTPIPFHAKSRFQTVRDGQQSVVVKVIEGGDGRGESASKIGNFKISGLGKGLPAGTHVDVTFRYDGNGLLEVMAKIPSTGDRASIQLDRKSGLTQQRRETMRDELDVIFDALDL